MREKALEYYMNGGCSCSESVIKAAIDEGLCDESLLAVSTAFSGGMSSGCVCGAVAAAQILSGMHFGRGNKFGNDNTAREKAAFIVEEFKKKHKVTCCRLLSKGLQGMERKQNCSRYVSDVCDLIEQILKVKV